MNIAIGTTVQLVGETPIEAVIPHTVELDIHNGVISLQSLLEEIERALQYWEQYLGAQHVVERTFAQRTITDLADLHDAIIAQMKQQQTMARVVPLPRTTSINSRLCSRCCGDNRALAKFCRHCGTTLASK